MARKGAKGRIGKGYQLAPPYDLDLPWNNDPRQPTTEPVSFDCNAGQWDLRPFGFGPGIPYPEAKNIEGLADD